MKKILFISTLLVMISCKEEPKEQIHLGDYNHPEAEVVQDSARVDSTAIDSTTVDSSAVQPEKKMTGKIEEDK